MAVLPIRFTERGRERLGVLILLVNLVAALAGVILIILGLYIKLWLDKRLSSLVDYARTDGVCEFLIVTGALAIAYHLFIGKVGYDSGFLKTRHRFLVVLLMIMLLLAIFSIVTLCLAVTIAVMKGNTTRYLENSFKASMLFYKDDPIVKQVVDEIQQQHQCCGAQTYSEWFDVAWISQAYLDMNDDTVLSKLEDGHYYTESVPFSCCSVDVADPCIHDNIMDVNLRRRYDPKYNATISRKGCVGILVDLYSRRVYRTAVLLFVILFALQWVVVFMLRYLQTSIESVYRQDDYPEAPASGYLLLQCPCSCLDELYPALEVLDQEVGPDDKMGSDGQMGSDDEKGSDDETGSGPSSNSSSPSDSEDERGGSSSSDSDDAHGGGGAIHKVYHRRNVQSNMNELQRPLQRPDEGHMPPDGFRGGGKENDEKGNEKEEKKIKKEKKNMQGSAKKGKGEGKGQGEGHGKGKDKGIEGKSKSGKSKEVKSKGIKSKEVKGKGDKSKEVKSKGVKSKEVNEKGIKSKSVKSKGVKSKHVKSKGVKGKGVKSKGVKSKGIKSNGVKSKGVKSKGVKSKGVKSKGIKSKGVKSKGVKSKCVKSKGVKSKGVKSKCVKSNSAKSKGVKSKGVKSKSAKSKGVKSKGVKSKGGKSKVGKVKLGKGGKAGMKGRAGKTGKGGKGGMKRGGTGKRRGMGKRGGMGKKRGMGKRGGMGKKGGMGKRGGMGKKGGKGGRGGFGKNR